MSDVTRTTGDIVQKLWSLCHILRDDGITYQEYVTELTYLLFLKMMQETGHEERIPNGYGWSSLAVKEGLEQLEYYRRMLAAILKNHREHAPTTTAEAPILIHENIRGPGYYH